MKTTKLINPTMKTKTKQILNDILEVVWLLIALFIIYIFCCMMGGQPL